MEQSNLQLNDTSRALVAVNESATIMSMIAQASHGGVDVANMQAMWTMYKDCKAHEAKVEFDRDFAVVKPLLPKVLKKRLNKQTKSHYAALEDVNEAVEPKLAEYGFSIRCPITAQDDKGVTVCATLTHKNGHQELSPLWMPYDDCGIKGEKNKTLPHAVKSSVTLAKSTAICALLNISMADDRGDGGDTGAAKVSEVQADSIREKLMQAPKETVERFKKAFGVVEGTEIPDCANVPKSIFDSVLATINGDIAKATQEKK